MRNLPRYPDHFNLKSEILKFYYVPHVSQIAHLKSYEAEVTQLRGLIHEQQRAIRVAARQIDQVRLNERLLQDDLNKIRTQGYTRKQQQELEEKWEEKTQTECNRLRAELIATNEEEMLKAIRQVVHEKDDQINALKRQFEAQQVALNHQVLQDHQSSLFSFLIRLVFYR